MQNRILILVLCIFVSIAASVTTSRMLVQPVMPLKQVSFAGDRVEMTRKINDYMKNGWICLHLSYGGYGSQAMVVMVKYK